MTDQDRVTLEQLCSAKEIVISTGSGGVGKTTTAAAIGAEAAAHLGGKVLVLTVDPARRLANALGLTEFGNTETRVPDRAFRDAGVDPRGELWVAMLDTKKSWDDLIRRTAPDARTRDEILANPLYRNISEKFVQSHDYVAMEELHEIYTSGRYDLIVVDTPPSRNAVDFLDAPDRMADFFSSRLLKWLIVPYRSRMVNLASKPFYSIADRILGTQFLQDIAEFFILFQSMYDGFVERAEEVQRLLGGASTSFVVVSTLEPAPAREAEYFLRLLDTRRLHVGALVLNKVLPAYLADGAARDVATQMIDEPERLAAALGDAVDGVVDGTDHLARVLGEIGESFVNFGVVASREMEQRHELSVIPQSVAAAPFLTSDITDLSALLELGDMIWR